MSQLNKKNILVVSGLFLPGWKGGGLIKTVVNLVENLKADFNFYVLTSDRDLGDVQPYENIVSDSWLDRGGYKVMYINEKKNTPKYVAKIINEVDFHILYLNSFFSKFTINILFTLRTKMIGQRKVIVAPKGEFGWGSFKQKLAKKLVYISMGYVTGLFKHVTWHVSSIHEKKDLQKYIKVSDQRVKIAIDIPIIYRDFSIENTLDDALKFSVGRPLRIIFLSRIVLEKNLDFCINVLKEVSCPIEFDVYGPKEDLEYWKKCESLVDKLPSNIVFKYLGPVNPADVQQIFKRYDLFFFPSLGENYGHVIAESLLVGTPVLISDLTPWQDLEENGMGWVNCVSNAESFKELIVTFAKGNVKESFYNRIAIRKAVLSHLAAAGDLKQNRDLFII